MDMHTQEPGPEHAVLERLAGNWISDETMPASPWCPEAQHRTGTACTRMFEGFFAVCDYEQSDGEGVSFRGHGVYSWDPGSENYVMYWFDSMGGAGGVATGVLDGEVLTFSSTSPVGRHRYRYTFQGDTAYVFEMAMSTDGETWIDLMHATYSKA